MAPLKQPPPPLALIKSFSLLGPTEPCRAIANKGAYNICSMCMSLGVDPYTTGVCVDALTEGIASARKAGIITAVASGNSQNITMISSPACGAASVSVGAVYDKTYEIGAEVAPCESKQPVADMPTCFSNSNNLLKLLAPGAVGVGGQSGFPPIQGYRV